MPLATSSFWFPDGATLHWVASELILIGTLAALLIVPFFLGRSARIAGIVAIVGTSAAALAAWRTFAELGGRSVELFGVPEDAAGVSGPGVLICDNLSVFFRLLLTVFLLAIIAVWALLDAPQEKHAPEFLTLLLASAIGMLLMTSSTHLILLIIAIELASMPSFALAGFDRLRRSAAEASLKYVLFGAITSGFMIYGASLLFGLYGSLDIPTIFERIAADATTGGSTVLLAVALLAFFAGVGFKVAAVPFHFWCPDVFEGASLSVATWLSVASKAAGVVLVIRLAAVLAEPLSSVYVEEVLPLIAYGVGFLAILTCTVANFAALRQSHVRRMLAYSSIAHAGYMLAAGAIVYSMTGHPASAVSAVAQYLVIYMFMNLGAFLTVGLVAADRGSEDVRAFTGLGWRDPMLAISLTICLVSLIGLPPMGGFLAKFWVIWALGESASAAPAHTSPVYWFLVIAIVINTAISLYYYLRVVRQMYLEKPDAAGAIRAPLAGKAIVHACAVALLLTGTLLAGPLKRSGDSITAAPATLNASSLPNPTPQPAGRD